MSKRFTHWASFASFSNLYANNLGGTDEYGTAATWSAVEFHGTDDFALCGFIKPTSIAGAGWIIGNGSGTNDRGWQIFRSGAKLTFHMYNAAFTRSQIVISTNDVLAANTKAHFVYVRDGEDATNHRLYINGVSVPLTVSTNTFLNTDVASYGNLRIGRRNRNDVSNYFEGEVFNPGIINIAPDATQAAAIHALGAGDLTTLSFGANVVAAFHFPGGQGDYPQWTNYADGTNHLTMQNQENTDIIIW